MTACLRTIAADDDLATLKYYAALLPQMGHALVLAVRTGVELVEGCRRLDPDLVITDIKMPDMEGIEAVHKIYEDKPRPIVLVSGYYDPKAFEPAVGDLIITFLLKPIDRDNLEEQIGHVMREYSEFEAIRQETAGVRQALRNRRIIQRAKALLCQSADVTEETAFARLQEVSRQQGRKLAIAAQMIVAASDAASA
jgi:response regulator NasT